MRIRPKLPKRGAAALGRIDTRNWYYFFHNPESVNSE